MSYTIQQLKDVSSAKDVLGLLNLNTPPYDPFYIAEMLGLDVRQDFNLDRMKVSGSISQNIDGRASIWINPLDMDARKKFTLAHEIGHYFHDILKDNHSGVISDTPDTLYRNSSDGSNVCEQRANKFAAELLMPSDDVFSKLTDIVEASPDGEVLIEEVIQKLSDVFEVSKAAITVRLKTLGIIHQSYTSQ